MILSEAAMRLGEEALSWFNPDNIDLDLSKAVDDGAELVDFLPAKFPVTMLRQRLDGPNGPLTWTVNITRSVSKLASTSNTQAGRSTSRNHATLAAIIRIYLQELRQDGTK